MKTTRRMFLGGIAAVSIPVSTAVAQTVVETQEEKCIRLAKELLSEFSKLPFHGESRAGPFVELANDTDIDCLRYVDGNHGLSSLVVMINLEKANP